MPGIFIAGELGGMGLIRNAIEQGRQAMMTVKKKAAATKGNPYDVVIIGAGPAGFSASLFALENKMRYVTLEQDSLGGTVSHYPRGKIVMTAPVQLPIVGKVRFRETTKEVLLSFWQKVAQDTGVKINYLERMESITPNGSGYEVKTTKGSYQTSTILLSIGRRGTPRKLNVPGEDQTKVVYRLIDPEQYRGQHVLVVGGGDSALEAAHSIADEPGTKVTLSYRSAAFSRAKVKNREKVERYDAEGKIKVLMSSNVKEILKDKVIIDQDDQKIILPNDVVIISAGGIVPTPLLKSIGIKVETKFGTT
jgi:thioredoxin reductase